jgi:hypothetical protein
MIHRVYQSAPGVRLTAGVSSAKSLHSIVKGGAAQAFWTAYLQELES